MTNRFNSEEVRKIARLSSLELSAKEVEVFAEQFSGILDYFEVLKTAEIPDVATDVEESHLSGSREDKMIESQVSPEQFSPYLENGFFKVPRVIEQSN
ncbi:MAG: Asp-tRNA(Asn)/Glu-tRNA(Gln) amidotransferase subunit GatC [SAR324 cluster bacterium]|nr:Asp-tRNA(Asn)/Glu-tRNA(Gln) amidotransferase subunit GatC [SAR324 cluster bacterium]MBL7035059.1 Asp-tRNA(Asn)/Glu-tRNA(Gln) amidotransferase subunit GatC [SAR324 cluster bacterium]